MPGSGTSGLCLAVDIGGSKLAAGLVDCQGRLDHALRVPTPVTTDAEELFDALAALVGQVRAQAPEAVTRCGVGCGGPMSAGGDRVSPLNIAAWRDFPLKRRLADHTGLDVTVDNDAKALALGEAWVGSGQGQPAFMAVVVSTGIGGGIVLDGRLLDGASGNAGHVGHVVVVPEGATCACGGRGCLEAEASGTAIAARTGVVAAEAPEGERVRAGTLLGRAVASVANLLDLPLTAVAGSVALGYGATFFDAANRELAARACLSFSTRSRIVPAGLGADGPLIGAGAVAWRAAGVAVMGES